LEKHELGFSYKMDKDQIEEEIRRLRLAAQPNRTDSATDGDIEERIRHLREEKARKVAMIEHLRAENQHMAQCTKRYNDECDRLEKEIEEFNRKRLSSPPDDKKT